MKNTILNDLKKLNSVKKLEDNIFTVRTRDFNYEEVLSTLLKSNNCYLVISSADLDGFFATTDYSVKNRLSEEIVFLDSKIDIDNLIENLLYIGGWILFGSKYTFFEIENFYDKLDFNFNIYPLNNMIIADTKKKYKIDFLIASFWDDNEWNIVFPRVTK